LLVRQTPREAIEGNYIDKKCPFTGNVSIRGRIISGVVKSTKVGATRPPPLFAPSAPILHAWPPWQRDTEEIRETARGSFAARALGGGAAAHQCAEADARPTSLRVFAAQMKRTLIIRRDYLHYIKKYNRYEKRHKNTPAHVSPAFIGIKEGDLVTVGQCRSVCPACDCILGGWGSLSGREGVQHVVRVDTRGACLVPVQAAVEDCAVQRAEYRPCYG
jgi:ribosomal protein S17